MAQHSLLNVYKSLRDPLEKIFVVPLIVRSRRQTSYLFNLYRYLIDGSSDSLPTVESLSVYAHFRFVLAQALGKNIILHYHWFEFQDCKSAAGMVWKALCIQCYKWLGGKIVWTIHNKEPHRNRWLKANYRIRKWMAHKADKLHVHCRSVIPELSNFFNVSPDKFYVHPHPRFPSVEVERKKAIEQINNHYETHLSVHKKTFLCFGNIARYKQIDDIIPLFNSSKMESELLVAGRVKKGNATYFQHLSEQATACENVTIINRFIPEEHVPWFFNGGDYVVFNHRRIIASGALEIARSYDKTIVAPSMGCIREYQDERNIHLFNTHDELETIVYQLSCN